MKKILWLFLVIFVLSCIVPEGNNVYAKSGTSLVASGATTEKDKAAINIDLKDNSGIWALKFKVSYDHSKLKLNSTQNGKVFTSGDVTLPESLDKDDFVFLASSNSLKDIEKNGTVITLHFKAKSYATEGKYPIKLTLIQAIDVDGKNVDMPPKELELLYFLASSPNQVFTREQLLDQIWGYEYVGDTRTVDVHIKRLREKIKDHPSWGLSTVWGIGYKFEVK